MEVTEPFDAYHKWLGIAPAEQPPTLYRLLGLRQFESDMDVIEAAADRQSAFLRTVQAGLHADHAAQLLNYVAGARICLIDPQQKATYDAVLNSAVPAETVPVEAILRKLDNDFFQGRWSRATDRQRDLLSVIAELPNCDAEFTVKEIVDLSKEKLKKPLKSSHVNQMLSSLGNNGLVYKNRHGKYSFAVPLLGKFIRRQQEKLRPNGQVEFGF